MATLANIQSSVVCSAEHVPASPNTGGILVEHVHPVPRMTSGSGQNQANVAIEKEYTIAGSGSQAVDFNAITDAQGATIALTSIRALWFHNVAAPNGVASGGTVTLSPGASNGWLSWITDAADTLNVRAGSTVGFATSDDSTGYAVSGTNKTLDIANGNSGSCTVRMVVLGVA